MVEAVYSFDYSSLNFTYVLIYPLMCVYLIKENNNGAPKFCVILIGSITSVSFVPLVKLFGMMIALKHFPLQVGNNYFMTIFCLPIFLVSQDLIMPKLLNRKELLTN